MALHALIASFIVFLSTIGSTPAADSLRTTAPMVIFSVSAGGKTGTWVDPIAFVQWRSGRLEFRQPRGPKGVMPERQFADTYYVAGTKYRAFRGGTPVGLVTIPKKVSIGCDWLARGVDTETEFGRGVAVGSWPLPERQSTRRAATDAERRAAAQLAGDVLRLKAAAPEAVNSVQVIADADFAVADMDGDGRADFAGTFYAKDAVWRHYLFVFACRDATGSYRVEVMFYNRVKLDDDSYRNNRSWSFVDNEDFDGDGVDEIVVGEHYFESTAYKILKRHHDAYWEIVYEGGGSGC